MASNILLVDDSFSMRSVIRKILALSRFQVGECHEASNGKEALDILAKNRVDVIITDINMPEMSGIEMLNYLRKDELLKHIPVIVVTTEANRERMDEAAKLGANGFLKKPFLPEELRRVLQAAVGISDSDAGTDAGQQEEGLDF